MDKMTMIKFITGTMKLVIVAVVIGGFEMQPAQAAPNADCYSAGYNLPWHSSSSWSCGTIPSSTDRAIIYAGHRITSYVTTEFIDVMYLDNGILDMTGSFVMYGSYYSWNGGRVTGGGTYNVLGITGTELCGGGQQALFTDGASGPGVNVSPATGVTINCSNGMQGGGWSASGTLNLIGNSTLSWWSIQTGGTLRISNNGTTITTLWNSGTLDVGTYTTSITNYTRNSGGTSSENRNIFGTGYQNFPWAAASVNVTVQGGLSYLDVRRIESAHAHENDNHGGANILNRYYTITPTGSDYTADLCFNYTDAELGGLPEANLRACRWTGSSWSCTRGPSSDTSANIVCANGVTQFSDWVIGAVGPTSIELSNLQADSLQNSFSLPAILAGCVGGGLAVLLVIRRKFLPITSK